MNEEWPEAFGNAIAWIIVGLAVVFSTWCTVIAFIGGTFPLTGVQTEGSFLLGVFFVFFVDGVMASVALWIGTPIALLVMKGAEALRRRRSSDKSGG